MMNKILPVFIAFTLITSVNAAQRPEFLLLVAFEKDVQFMKTKTSFLGAPIKIGDRSYHRVNFEDKFGLVAVSKAGLQQTALTVDIALLKMKAKRLISFGVAGAISDEFSQGDVVIVNKVACHDRGSFSGSSAFKPAPLEWHTPLLDPFLREIHSLLSNKCARLERNLKQGEILAGNTFIASTQKREWLHETFHGGLVDMNSAAITESCGVLNVPHTIIRVVSDSADENARDDFSKFIESREILSVILESLIESILMVGE